MHYTIKGVARWEFTSAAERLAHPVEAFTLEPRDPLECIAHEGDFDADPDEDEDYDEWCDSLYAELHTLPQEPRHLPGADVGSIAVDLDTGEAFELTIAGWVPRLNARNPVFFLEASEGPRKITHSKVLPLQETIADFAPGVLRTFAEDIARKVAAGDMWPTEAEQ